MKRVILASLFSSIILTFILLMDARIAHAQSLSPALNYDWMSGNPQTGPLTDTCGVTMTWSHSFCNQIDSGSTWNSTHSGLHGTQTYVHGDWSGYPFEQCGDYFTVTMHAGDVITFTATGNFPFKEDAPDDTPSYPYFWCDSLFDFQIVTSTQTYVEGTYTAPAGVYDYKVCGIGHAYGHDAKWHYYGPASFSWSWAVGMPCEHCVVKDPHMEMAPPMSPWQAIIGDYTLHEGSEWILAYPSRIHQSIVLTSGTYSVLVRARTTNLQNGPVLQIQLGANLSEINLNSTSEIEYTTIIVSDGGQQDFALQVSKIGTSVIVDYICILEAKTCSLPCGMGTSDATLSQQYLLNSEMYGLEFPPGLWSVNCSAGVAVPGGVGLACSTHKADVGLVAYHWSGSGVNAAVSGVKRWSTMSGICGQALGLMPPPLQNGTSQVLNMRPGGPYNIALKMKRDYGNSRLTVCGQTIDYTPVGEWIDASFYCQNGDNSITLLADCTGGSCVSHYQGPNVGDYSAVEVDDVYLIPGGEISCTVPLVVPTLDCINQNPHLIGLSSGSEMVNGPPQLVTEESWNLSNARMGSIAAREFSHQARLWPSNGDSFIHQYVAANSETIADVDAIVPGRSYSITVAAKLYGTGPVAIDVAVGAQSPGEQTWNISLDGANASTVWSSGFVATSDMLNGDNMGLRVGNTGGSVLLDSVCISTGGPAITPTQCLGDWLSSSGGNPYDGPTPAEDYVYNVTDLNGYYRLDIAGVADSSGSLDVGYYWDVPNPPTEGGQHSDISSVAVGEGDFSETVTFPTGYGDGQLRIVTHQNTTFTSICLSKYDAPGGDGPPPPASIPECGSVSSHIRTPLFYMMSPYSITVEYTGTAPAYYVAELTYDYAIYPLVCTTISIANWQFDMYAQFKAAFDSMVAEFRLYFLGIIAALWAIWAKIGQGIFGGFDFLSLLWQLFLMLLRLLLKFLMLIYQVFDLVIATLKNLSANSKGDYAVTYPIHCTGDAKWMCLGLASIIAVDNYAGNWIRLVTLLALGCLTVGLIFWLSGQIRAMAQPGDTKSHE